MSSTKKKANQSNQLVESCYSVTLTEKRLLLLAISKIDSKQCYDTNTPLSVTVSVAEWNRFFLSENPYQFLQSAAELLRGRFVRFHPKCGIIEDVNWFESVKYQQSKACINLVFTRAIQKRLVALKEQFTSIDMSEISLLNSIHSVRLYELIMQFKTRAYRDISIADFRFAMGCCDRYKTIGDLKRYVLIPALNEINKKTKVSVSVENKKKGRLVTGLMFSFSIKENSMDTQLKPDHKTASFLDKHKDTSWADGL